MKPRLEMNYIILWELRIIYRYLKKLKKYLLREYQEYLNMKREYDSKPKNIAELPPNYVLTKTNPASRNKGGKRTNRRIKKNNKSRKGKSIKNRRK